MMTRRRVFLTMLLLGMLTTGWAPPAGAEASDSGDAYRKLQVKANELQTAAEKLYDLANKEKGKSDRDKVKDALVQLKATREAARTFRSQAVNYQSTGQLDAEHRSLESQIDLAGGGLGYFSADVERDFKQVRELSGAIRRLLDEPLTHNGGKEVQGTSYKELQATADQIDSLAQRISKAATKDRGDSGKDEVKRALEHVDALKKAATSFRSQVEKYHGEIKHVDEEFLALKQHADAVKSQLHFFDKPVADDYEQLARKVRSLKDDFGMGHGKSDASSGHGDKHGADDSVDNGMAPRTLGGSQLHYSDNHGKNTYTFFEDGRFKFTTQAHNKASVDSHEGHWQYAITSPSHSIVTFDNDQPIRLTFSDPLTASGTIEGDQRTYKFTITRPDGE